ncbi:MAG: cobyrinate a,c-diamide synthase [Betaproteobacteria bacterium]|nr:cobyrinate a,c-diamide synthase [Betaproteobacteria bacterium]
MSTPRILVSASHKSSGKTTVTIGLCAALFARGHRVQPFKKGPDYIDPMWLTAASRRDCHNLDPYLSGEATMIASFARHAIGADVCIVEGNKGLYDGLDLDGSNSNAAVAHALGLPVILVIDARGMTRGIAPLLLGYQAFDRNLNIAGVILNNLGGARHESKLRAVIEHYTDLPVVGAVQRDELLAVDERHLGLMPSGELDDATRKIDQIGEIISAQVDLERILSIAASAPPLDLPDIKPAEPRSHADRPLRIGVAHDKAFGFYYAEDLAALEDAGATLVPIDTLRQRSLPALDGLVIGGGFPEVFMAELEANIDLRRAIADAIHAGLPTYAECGGLMYLAKTLTWKGRTCEMAGVIPGDAVMHDRPVGRGYVQLAPTGNLPWSAAMPATVRGHEFHYSSLENLPASTCFGWKVMRGHGIDGQRDGIVIDNLVASYAHLRGVDNWVQPFVAFVRQKTLSRDTMRANLNAPPGVEIGGKVAHACA